MPGLQQYFKRDNSSEGQINALVEDSELGREIKTLSNRKSLGQDGTDAETTKLIRKWLTPYKIMIRNCQISYNIPTQWLQGVMTFYP